MTDKHLRWIENSKKQLFDCRLFTVNESNRSLGKVSGNFIVLDAPDWVNVIPLIREKNEDYFLMVKQFRHGNSELTLEFPAGVIEKNEDPELAGKRELIEETGYKAENLIFLGKVNPNPAFMSNCCYTYLAVDPQKTHEQNLDEHEFVDFEKISVKEVEDKMGRTPYSNGIMLMAMFWYEKYLKSVK